MQLLGYGRIDGIRESSMAADFNLHHLGPYLTHEREKELHASEVGPGLSSNNAAMGLSSQAPVQTGTDAGLR